MLKAFRELLGALPFISLYHSARRDRLRHAYAVPCREQADGVLFVEEAADHRNGVPGGRDLRHLPSVLEAVYLACLHSEITGRKLEKINIGVDNSGAVSLANDYVCP